MQVKSIDRVAAGWRPGQPVWLESRNYFMRSLVPADAACMKVWWADPEIMAPLRKNADNYSLRSIERYIRRFDNETGFLLGIFVKATGQHIGWRRAYHDLKKGSAINDVAVGVKSFQSRGVNYELQNAFYDFMFYSAGVKRMTATAYADNVRSCRRAERLGFRSTGIVAEKHYGTDGVWHDVIWYELTERDWRATRRWFYSPVWRADYWNGARAA